MPDPSQETYKPHQERARAWVVIRAFPPGIQPTFLGSIWFWHHGRAEARLPALHMFLLEKKTIEGEAPPMRFINLFFDPDLGGATILDEGAGWRRIDFTFSLPPDHGGVQVRAVIERPDADGTLAIEAGRLEPVLSVWRFEPAVPLKLPFAASETPPLRPGFIGGAPKSGTTWMQILLNQHQSVMASGEGSLLYNVAVRANQSVNRWLAPGMSQPALNDMGNQALLLRMLQTYRQHTGCAWVVDKTPGNARFYRRLLACAPHAKLIHCVRHPLDVAASRLHHEANFIANGKTSNEMAEHAAALKGLPAMLAAGGPLELDAGMWAVLARVLDVYAAAQREALETLRERPEKLLIVRYEDMLADTLACAMRVFAHLGVPTTPQHAADCVRNASFGNLRDKRQGRAHPFFRSGTQGQYDALFIVPDQARAMAHLRACLPEFDQLGYALELA